MEEMTPVAQELVGRMDVVCEKLGVAGEAVWQMCIREVYTSALTTLASFFIVLIIYVCARVVAVQVAGLAIATGNFDKEDVAHNVKVANTVILAVCMVFTFIWMGFARDAVSSLFNVEYSALEALRGLIRSIGY